MSFYPIRLKEAVVQITEDGKKLLGTLENITDFEVTPDSEIAKTRYAGETRQRPDLDVKGFDFTFNTNTADHFGHELSKRFEDAERNGTAFPVISLSVTNRYRGAPHRTMVLYGNLILKVDTFAYPGDGYVSIKWSGSCQEILS